MNQRFGQLAAATAVVAAAAALGACQVQKDPANETTTVSFDANAATNGANSFENAADRVANGAENAIDKAKPAVASAAHSVGNAADRAGEKVKNVHVDVHGDGNQADTSKH